jgi:hypothetical protein
VKINVLVSQWAADDQVFEGGEQEIDKPSAALLRLLAAGEAAGVLEVLDAAGTERTKMDAAVESQEDSEKALEKAQISGEWFGANYDQFLLDVESGMRPAVDNLPDRDTFIEERKG